MRSLRMLVVSILSLVFVAPALAEEVAQPVLNVGGIDRAGGTIKGVVKFEGDQKKGKVIDMSAVALCHQSHENPVTSELFVFGDNDTLQNVFVYVSKGLEGKTFGPDLKRVQGKPVIDQHGCVYIPHVQGVEANQPIEIKNSDNTLHNVNCQPKRNDPFNSGMPVPMSIEHTFTKPDMGVSFKCEVHPWMTAYVNVMAHPFYAVTQKDGSFTIKGLEPGEYEVTVWHEFDKFKPAAATQKVTVKADEAAEVNFTYSPPK